ncbi:2-oxoadipate dioxygenase/decarboxylase family protein [Streptomyces sp. NPDC048288]|uniref:2-oxoadipate dioxygenase/decarboxylase family protein n=1 Tax=Streptomyces sp. NPDC048288 TaxID=3365529 RepID=UPI00371C3C53
MIATGPTVSQWQLRAAFAVRLSEMYGREVPAYTTLVDVSREVNEDVLRARGAGAERFGSLARVTAERHGAIRVGTPRELGQVARVFGALGMHPVGFYDLREAAASAVPVVSTAFRPVDGEELARNPFRVFTSLLTPADPRFFDAELRARLEVRFGEVEARGIALTRTGRALYDDLLDRIDTQASEHPTRARDDIARTVWERHMPGSEEELAARGLAYFTYRLADDRPRDGGRPPAGIGELVRQGWLRAEPVVYEDFLPRSAAGIFQSNLGAEGTRDDDRQGTVHDADWLSGALGRELLDPFALYEQQQNRSLAQVARTLGLTDPPRRLRTPGEPR